MRKSNLYRYHQSSEQQDDSSNQQDRISPAFVKSAVFNNNQAPLIKSGGYENKYFDQINNEVQEQQSHLRPKLKIESPKKVQADQNQKCIENVSKYMDNVSGLYSMKKQSVSQANFHKKAVNAAYTFKLKSPNPARKKNDPVSLFQQTTTSWKKDKFLTSRTDLKEGRKLQLQKRNKQYV